MNHFNAVKRVLFSSEFYLTEKLIPFCAYIGIPGFIIFYFTCRYQGFWDSLLLRILIALILLPFLFYPRNKQLSFAQKIYFESVLFLILPVFFSYMYFKTGFVTYWFISVMWAGLVYGMLSAKALVPILFFPIGFFLGALAFIVETDVTFDVIKVTLGAFSIAWFSAILSSISKLATTIFYILSLDAESMRIKADEAEKRRSVLETKNAELLARNVIISTFVRPSILTEVNNGKDPRLFRPRIVDKAILICDMRNFTPLTSCMIDADVQAQFINKYFEMMIAPVFESNGEVDKLMGDAIMAVFSSGHDALTAALEMRNRLQIYNKQLTFAGLQKIGNVISISKGVTLEANIGGEQKLDRTYIGAAVNICSRLESVAKLYGIEVIVTKEILDDSHGYHDSRLVDIIKVKGYSTKFEVYEIFGHQAPVVVDFKNRTKKRLHEGIRKYFERGNINVAAEIFKEILQQMPPHKYHEGRMMDNIVHYYATRCVHFMQHPDMLGRALNQEEGCHDFGNDLLPRDWSNVSLENIIAQLNESSDTDKENKDIDTYAKARLIEDEKLSSQQSLISPSV